MMRFKHFHFACLVAVLSALLAGVAPAAVIDVMADVDGMMMSIGSIDAKSGPADDTDHMTANFSFAAGKGYLDKWYDFQWLQIVSSITIGGVEQATNPLIGKIPAIDPAPSDNPAGFNDGPAPWYYNGKEWSTAMFGTEKIAKEGEFSLLSDSPQQAAGTVVTFKSYLVAEEKTTPNSPSKEFCVLAGFTWTYSGTGDASTVGAMPEIAVNAANVKQINDALGNASVGGNFNGWKAVADCSLTACLPPPIWVPKLFLVSDPTPVTTPGSTDPIVATVSLSPNPTVPIEIVQLSLQSVSPALPVHLQAQTGPPSAESFFDVFVDLSAPPLNLTQAGFHFNLALTDPSGMNFIPTLPEFFDNSPTYSGFRAGDSFFDIFFITGLPGGNFQEWIFHGQIDPGIFGHFSGLSITPLHGPLGNGSFDSFFDIFVELSLDPGHPVLGGQRLFSVSLQASQIPQPVAAFSGSIMLCLLALRRAGRGR